MKHLFQQFVEILHQLSHLRQRFLQLRLRHRIVFKITMLLHEIVHYVNGNALPYSK